MIVEYNPTGIVACLLHIYSRIAVAVRLVRLLQVNPESYLSQMGKEEVTGKFVCIEFSVSPSEYMRFQSRVYIDILVGFFVGCHER